MLITCHEWMNIHIAERIEPVECRDAMISVSIRFIASIICNFLFFSFLFKFTCCCCDAVMYSVSFFLSLYLHGQCTKITPTYVKIVCTYAWIDRHICIRTHAHENHKCTNKIIDDETEERKKSVFDSIRFNLFWFTLNHRAHTHVEFVPICKYTFLHCYLIFLSSLVFAAFF